MVKETVAKGREIPRSDMGKSDERGRHNLSRRYVLRCRVESALKFSGLPTLGAASDATDRHRMHGVPDDRSPDRRRSLRKPISMYVGFGIRIGKVTSAGAFVLHQFCINIPW
jgi:hypothetical protein